MSSPQTDRSCPQVAYLGPVASFSHQAALEYFDKTADLHPHPSFSAIFNALQTPSTSGAPITHAIVPIENSSNGTVVSLLDLLADPENKYSDIEVCAEYYLSVHHCLLVHPSSVPPTSTGSPSGTDSQTFKLRNIKTLLTHPQVWTQCTRFLSKHLGSTERIDTSSTSAAAIHLNRPSAKPSDAAIGSSLAAQTFDLTILAANIEDEGNNTTRFLVLRNSSTTTTATSPSPSQPVGGRKQKSLITFTLNHAQPGTLASALHTFKQHALNLTSIDTRPSRQRPWHYIFCVECESAATTTGSGSGRVSAGRGATEKEEGSESAALSLLLGTLRQTTERCRYLGTWSDALEPRDP